MLVRSKLYDPDYTKKQWSPCACWQKTQLMCTRLYPQSLQKQAALCVFSSSEPHPGPLCDLGPKPMKWHIGVCCLVGAQAVPEECCDQSKFLLLEEILSLCCHRVFPIFTLLHPTYTLCTANELSGNAIPGSLIFAVSLERCCP